MKDTKHSRRSFLHISALATGAVIASLSSFANKRGVAAYPKFSNLGVNTQTNAALLRFFVPVKDRKNHLDELFRTCEKIGTRDVLLFSSDYICNEVFVSGDMLKARIEHLQICADKIRKEGLTFNLNVMQTLGHLYIPSGDIERFNLQRQLDADGNPGRNPGQIDPACPNLHENLVETYRQYAALKPRLLFLDDDYKVPFEQCFAPQRITQFAQRWGCSDDRRTIAGLLASSDKNTRFKARKLMSDLISDDLSALASNLQKAVHDENPDIQLGLMFANMPTFDIQKVAGALAGPYKPFVRPQLPLYREDSFVTEYPDRWWFTEYWKAQLGKDYGLYPECENYPYYTALKSPSAAYAHNAAILGAGELKVALSLNSFSTEVPANDSPILVNYFEKNRGQIGTVNKKVLNGGMLEGAGIWDELESIRLGIESVTTPGSLLLKGLPARAASEIGDADIVWGNSISFAADAEIEELLNHSVVFDMVSAKVLVQRGFASKIGLDSLGHCNLSELVYLGLERENSKKELFPFYYFVSRLKSDQAYPFKWQIKEAIQNGSYTDADGRPMAPFVLKWTGPSGAKFSLINLDMRRFGKRVVSPWINRAVVDAVEWVKPLPAKVIDSRNLTLKCLNINNGNGYLFTLCNLSTGIVEEVKIQPNEVLASSFRWNIINKDGELEPININDKGIINLKIGVRCLGVLFIYGEKKG